MRQRVILHADMNNFYASVECLHLIRVTDVCRAASMKAGGIGVRDSGYWASKYHYYEEDRWFIGRREA